MGRKILGFLCSLLLFCLHVEGQKKIGIFTYGHPNIGPVDPDSVHKGLPGAEEAVIYMAQKLAEVGYDVTVLGNPSKDSSHSLPSANPRFISANSAIPSFDIAISWRMPRIGKDLKRYAPKVYFWPHDVRYDFPLADQEINETKGEPVGFDDVLWLSKWQREQWASVNPIFASFTKTFGNGINPEQFNPIKEKENPYSCIYASNYSRGLEELLEFWPTVKKQFPKATLDIYYGWNHWGNLSPERESYLKEHIERLKPLGVEEHGQVSHETLARAFEKASFWTYPCKAEETFCITALKAQFAGTVPVVIEGSALTETCRHGFSCFTLKDYLPMLLAALGKAEKISLQERENMRSFILEKFTWKNLALAWKELFESPKLYRDSQRKNICLTMTTCNQENTLRQSLQSVKDYITYWVIVDKNSSDRTKQIIEEELKGVSGELHTESFYGATPEETLTFLTKGKGDYTLFLHPEEKLCFSSDTVFTDLQQDAYNFSQKSLQSILCKNGYAPSSVKTSARLSGAVSIEADSFFFPAVELAASHLQNQEYPQALKIYESYLNLFPSYLSFYYQGLKQELEEASKDLIYASYLASSQESPEKQEPLFRLAFHFFKQNNYEEGYKFAKKAVSLPYKDDTLCYEPWIHEYGSLFLLAFCAFEKGLYNEAKGVYESLSQRNLPEDLMKTVKNHLVKIEELSKKAS